MVFKMPKNYYLVIAIDHERESELTGIDYSLLEKDPADPLDNSRYGYLEMYLMNRDYPEVFPIIQREDLSIPLHLSLTVEELDVDLAEYKEKCRVEDDKPLYYCDPDVEDDILAELNEKQALSSEEYEFDLSPFQSPFDGVPLEVTEEFEIDYTIGGSGANDSGVYYVAEKIDYDLSADEVRVNLVEDGNPPSYKHVKQEGESYEEVYDPSFMVWNMGEFSVPEGEDTLAASPLGIYGSEDVQTEDGTQLDRKSTRLNSSHVAISYAVFCLKKKIKIK